MGLDPAAEVFLITATRVVAPAFGAFVRAADAASPGAVGASEREVAAALGAPACAARGTSEAGAGALEPGVVAAGFGAGLLAAGRGTGRERPRGHIARNGADPGDRR